MRLIDADALEDYIKSDESGLMADREFREDYIECIDEMPTIFDLENVLKQLQSELSLSDKEKERCARENPLQFDEAKGYSRGMAVALEILNSAANPTNGKIGG
ncbi:MAG: hypothetical protein NC489_19505 [Ruminococcus flavefaciens]|nr:hypothetical protein [Ruminococcus flavefaciens]